MAELKYIVRLIGKDLDGTKAVENGVCGIKGVGKRMGMIISGQFKKENGIKGMKKLGELNDEEIKKLEDVITNPAKHDIPGWALNRQKDFESGETMHKTMNELDFGLRTDLQRLAEIKSYRGLRHMWGLTVRGQKTRSTHRGKGGVVGVVKKDVKKAGGGAKEEKK
ncbi:MAG: 30S ribosomal protein S13 [Candidatus Diapherotrites archaeon]|nr:30S ribosomal protein S13 [Candidatus Diapherotrites archaeon]